MTSGLFFFTAYPFMVCGQADHGFCFFCLPERIRFFYLISTPSPQLSIIPRTVRDIFHYPFRKKRKIKKRRGRRTKTPKKYPRLLKLHGSINWFAKIKNAKDEGGKGLISTNWSAKGKYGEVVMMPPKMVKEEIWAKEAPKPQSGAMGNSAVPEFYPKIWKEAQDQLEKCRRIVFIGYSFPPADFAVGNMIRRAISKMKVTTQKFPNIDIVDPNAAELAKRFEQSFKIKVPTENQYLSLRNYLDSARAKAGI